MSENEKRRIRVVSAAIVREGRYLITQRNPTAVLPLLWEFPGGRVEDGEDDAGALIRELEHRLGVQATVSEKISETDREYDEYIVHLALYACDIGDQEPKARSVLSLQWVASDAFDTYEFTPADQESMDALLLTQH